MSCQTRSASSTPARSGSLDDAPGVIEQDLGAATWTRSSGKPSKSA
jgi:hypothetical protein